MHQMELVPRVIEAVQGSLRDKTIIVDTTTPDRSQHVMLRTVEA